MLIIPELQDIGFIIRVNLSNQPQAWFHCLRRTNGLSKPIASRLKSHAQIFADEQLCRRYMVFLAGLNIESEIELVHATDPHLGTVFSSLKTIRPDQARIEYQHRRLHLSTSAGMASQLIARSVVWSRTKKF